MGWFNIDAETLLNDHGKKDLINWYIHWARIISCREWSVRVMLILMELLISLILYQTLKAETHLRRQIVEKLTGNVNTHLNLTLYCEESDSLSHLPFPPCSTPGLIITSTVKILSQLEDVKHISSHSSKWKHFNESEVDS